MARARRCRRRPATPGTIGTLGVLLLGVVLLGRLAAGRVRGFLGDRRLVAAGLLTLASFLIGTAGGISAFIAFFFSSALRAYNRISWMIAFLALFAVAVALDRLLGRFVPARRLVAAGLLALVLVVGVLDQTPVVRTAQYDEASYEWGVDARFAAAINERLGGNGEVYQIPYLPYPESPPIRNMSDYSPLKPYVHSPKTIRWSYGAMKGRPEDWQGRLSQQPLQVQLPAAAALGFDGVYVDLAAYESPDAEAARVAALTGQQPLRSQNGRLVFFDLRPLAARVPADRRLPARQALLNPVDVSFGEGFYDEEIAGASHWRWAAAKAAATITNSTGAMRRVRVRAQLLTQRTATATVALDGKPVATLRTDDDGEPLDVTVDVAPGTLVYAELHRATEKCPGRQARDLHVQVSDYVVADAPVAAVTTG